VRNALQETSAMFPVRHVPDRRLYPLFSFPGENAPTGSRNYHVSLNKSHF